MAAAPVRFPRAKANGLVVTSMLATGAIVVVGEASRGELPKPRRLLALGAVYVGLAGMATFAPALAGPFALVVLLGTALRYGEDAAQAVVAGASSDAPLGAGERPHAIGDDDAGEPIGGGAPSSPVGSAGGNGGNAGWKLGGGPGAGTHSYTERGSVWQDDTAYDLMAAAGTEVRSPVAGTVTRISGTPSSAGGDPRFAGYGVTINGVLFFKHLGTLGNGIHVGAPIARGQLIGTLDPGTQGGPHLHLAAKTRAALDAARDWFLGRG